MFVACGNLILGMPFASSLDLDDLNEDVRRLLDFLVAVLGHQGLERFSQFGDGPLFVADEPDEFDPVGK